MSSYFSFGQQSAHYFGRPHDRVTDGPVGGAAAWRGEEVAGRDDWRTRLDDVHVDELLEALGHARHTGRPTESLTADDFPLPTLGQEITRWRENVEAGLAFHVVSGVPVDGLAEAEVEMLFWCLGLHFGRPGAQNPQGDLIGHVTDTGDDAADPFVRLYRTSADIAYHCDAADVVGLLCLHTARKGGASRIASSVTVHDELFRTRPELTARLFEPFQLDIRNEDSTGTLRTLPIPPCRYAGGRLRTFYHSDYFRSAVRHEEVPDFTEAERELLDTYEGIASQPGVFLDMELEPGDIQWLSNHTILHARTGYEDDEGDAPEHRRHLLRLWLSLAG